MEGPNLEELKKLYHNILDITGPSGTRFIIREQNGNDDDLLSSEELREDFNNMNIFLCGIVIWTDRTKSGKLSVEDSIGLAIKDKYFLLFQSRIFSIGADIKFSFNWGESNGGEVFYTEDLSPYVWDFTDEKFPVEGDDNYFAQRMKPYMVNPYEKVNTTLTSGKRVRFDLANGHTEKFLAAKGKDISRSDNLVAMGLELEVDGKWMVVKSFKYFTKREMVELNKIIDDLEQPFYGISEIKNPKTGQIELYPLIVDPAFFFPLEI